jgi:hypothetical protein
MMPIESKNGPKNEETLDKFSAQHFPFWNFVFNSLFFFVVSDGLFQTEKVHSNVDLVAYGAP